MRDNIIFVIPLFRSAAAEEPSDSSVSINVDEESLAAGGSTGILLKKLVGGNGWLRGPHVLAVCC